MAVYYFDASGIVKRYIRELGSEWVVRIADPAAGNRVHVVSITGVEVVSAITRRMLSGSISAADARMALADFRNDFANQYRVASLALPVIERAMSLAEAHALRAYDAARWRPHSRSALCVCLSASH